MKKHTMVVLVVFALAVFISGCAKRVMQDGKQVTIFVLSDRGIVSSNMSGSERDDRNEVGQFMEEDLLKTLQDEGYLATLIQDRNQFVPGTARYLLVVKIETLRLVGGASRFFLGRLGGPTILATRYEVFASNNTLAFVANDKEATTEKWYYSPQELNQRLVKKINTYMKEKSKK
jgi:hypothetical protein